MINNSAKKTTFSRWSQFNLEHTKDLMWLALKHPKAHAILYFLVDQMDHYNAIMCSYQVLQEIMSVSKDTIRRNLRVLKERGFISILKSGTSNVYAINDGVYWKSWGDKREYSKFPANVILSISEQDNDLKDKIKKSVTHKFKEVTTE